MTRAPSVTCVIMAGGKGERLWPLVRNVSPKVCLSPDGGLSLLARTVERFRSVWPRSRWLIVTTAGQAAAVRRALPPALRSCVVVEPEIKNTAACLTLAAAIIAAHDPDGVLVAAPADHWVSDAAAFRRSIRAAVSAAVRHQTIATIGIRPTSPDPGLGYLCARARHLVQFIEKPPRAVAARLIRRPGTYWNSGMFVSPARVLLDRIARHLPAHARRLVPLGSAWGTRRFPALARQAYRGLNAISFDHGVMVHMRDGVVVKGRFGWTDLGSWDAWAKAGRSSTRTLSIESKRVTVVGNHEHLVATIGVRDLVVVHTPSATLICPPSHAQRVREIVTQLWQDPQWAPYR